MKKNEFKIMAKNKHTGEYIIQKTILSDLELVEHQSYMKELSILAGKYTSAEPYLYHVTPKQNIDSIMANGIKVGTDACVYLVQKKHIDKSIFKVKLYNNCDNSDIAIVKIKVSSLDREKLYNSPDNTSKGSYVYFSDIDSNLVKLL